VVDLVVLACVLRATTKKVNFLPCPPIFSSRTAHANDISKCRSQLCHIRSVVFNLFDLMILDMCHVFRCN